VRASINCALNPHPIRKALDVPSTTCATQARSHFAKVPRRAAFVLHDARTANDFEVGHLGEMVRISSWTPSAKNAFRFSSLRFSKGRTAMLLSGTCASVGLSGTAREIPGELLRRRTKKLKAKAMPANTTAVMSADLKKNAVEGRAEPQRPQKTSSVSLA